MYLTRFRINTERVGARKLLSSPQTLHAAVMSSFAELPVQQDGLRVLWRIDRGARHRTHLCIVSPSKPGDAFRRTLTHGLGKARAYGCGLMTLAPA